jgi:transglutaminase-like putative cysteine protease
MMSSPERILQTPASYRLIRAIILAAACWVLSAPLTTVSGSAAAFFGCLAAVWWLDGRQPGAIILKLRTPVVLLLLLILVMTSSLGADLLTRSQGPSAALGAMTIYQLGQLLFWASLAASIALALRLYARRYSWGSLPELVFVASAFVITLAAHQRGMIDRPYFIGDYALIRGLDPSNILMGIGVLAVLTLTVLLMLENRQQRLFYHVSVLAMLCFSLLIYVRFFGMPTPSMTDDLGLTGQAANRGSSQSENPFRDGENDANDREAPVAIVLFRDDYEPEGGAYYFRESAYSQFNGQMLWTAERDDLDLDLVEQFPASPVSVSEHVPGQDKRRSVTTTIGLLTPHRSPFGLDSPVRFEPAPNPNSLRFRQTYTVESLVPAFDFADLIGRKAGSPDWTIAQWQEYLAMPDDPRYGEFAQHLASGVRAEFAEDPYAKALAVKDWLDRNGIYSLKNAHAYAADPAASFLFGDVTGYCIHFAYAATYMYRSLGIPARVAVGYSVPSANRAGGSALLIQAVNGHAWPEIYLEGLGWVIVDPAPAQTLVDMSVDPQDTLQQLLGDMLRNDDSFQAFLNQQAGNTLLSPQLLLRVLSWTALILLLLAYAVRLWRSLLPLFAPQAEQYRLRYRAALDTLSAHGVHRRFGESREAFARRWQAQFPALLAMTELHLKQTPGYAFAPSPGAGATLSVDTAAASTAWRSLQQQLQRELAVHIPGWRRLLATLHPTPWYNNY